MVSNNYVVDTNTNTLLCNNQVIASGIESMVVYFGIDSDDDGVPNRWLRPDVAADLSDAVAVRVHLLTVTNGSKLNEGPQTFYFDNQVRETEGDGQIRREYSMTVATRNQF